MQKGYRPPRERIKMDAFWILVSIVVASVLYETGTLHALVGSNGRAGIIGTFISGIFFTSVFTITPSTAVFVEIMHTQNIWLTAFLGAFGALLGDLLLVLFIRDHVSKDLAYLLGKAKHTRVWHIIHLKSLRSLSPIIGALVIASPLPDEIGVAMLGASKLKIQYIVAISYCMNFLGIVLVGLFAR